MTYTYPIYTCEGKAIVQTLKLMAWNLAQRHFSRYLVVSMVYDIAKQSLSDWTDADMDAIVGPKA